MKIQYWIGGALGIGLLYLVTRKNNGDKLVKITFQEYTSGRCFAVYTINTNLIDRAIKLKESGIVKWISGVLRSGTNDNVCINSNHQWHYETLVLSDNVVEECQTTISGIETHSDIWLNRVQPTCLYGKIIDVV